VQLLRVSVSIPLPARVLSPFVHYGRTLSVVINKMSVSDKEIVELLYELKKLPDFDCLPLPDAWYTKFNLPPKKVINPREFMESNYAMEIALAPKDLPPLIIDEPQQGGKLVQFIDEPPPEVTLRSRPFEHDPSKPFPAVLVKDDDPILSDAALPATASQHHTSSSELSASLPVQQGGQETDSQARESSAPVSS